MNRWLARLAAAAMGLSCVVAIIYVVDGLSAYAVAWFLTALFAACWWATQRSLIAAEERAERLETDAWILRGAASDVRTLATGLNPGEIREVEVFVSDVHYLLDRPQHRGQERQS